LRLASISVANFRGFSTRRTIDLDADIVIVWGANGTGKTSLLDAMQWLVLGDVPRLRATVLRSHEDVITNRYADGPVSVEVAFRGAGGTTVVTRTGTGKDGRLTVRKPDGVLHEEARARAQLANLIGRGEDHDDAGKWFLRTHLLQQAEMTELLSGDTKERYRFLSQLTGLDELGQLDDQLQRELKQLRAAVRERERELEEARDRVAVARSEHEQSTAILASQEAEQGIALECAASVVARLLDTEDPPSHAELQAAAAHRLAEIEFLIQGARKTPSPAAPSVGSSELERLRAAVAEFAAEPLTGQPQLLEIEGRLAKLEESLRALERERDDTARLAQLALAALGEECPVCGQAHDLEQTRARLHEMLKGDDRATVIAQQLDALRLERAMVQAAVTEQHAALVTARENLERAENAARAAGENPAVRAQLEERLRGVAAATTGGPALIAQAEQYAAQLGDAIKALEAKTGDVERSVSLHARNLSAQRDLEAREGRLAALEAAVTALSRRCARAEAVCKWVGQEIVAATGRVIDSSNPLAGELYRRLDVHPTFRRFSLKLDRFRESGHLRPWVHDDAAEKNAGAAQLLSAAQFNSLAVCLFLALNLEQQRALNSIVLDDPVQSMDDINVLSLVDVLRTVRCERQVVLTTHDIVLAQLLLRKLRPLEEDQRVLFVTLGSWTRDGPEVKIEDYRGASRPRFEVV
jgi:DNA repair exonuclease SbcCD ATPase subunit